MSITLKNLTNGQIFRFLTGKQTYKLHKTKFGGGYYENTTTGKMISISGLTIIKMVIPV